jgi:hypothetical protein
MCGLTSKYSYCYLYDDLIMTSHRDLITTFHDDFMMDSYDDLITTFHDDLITTFHDDLITTFHNDFITTPRNSLMTPITLPCHITIFQCVHNTYFTVYTIFNFAPSNDFPFARVAPFSSTR